jgi:hypothetical protein
MYCIVTELLKAFLGNGSVSTVNVNNGRCVSVDECYCALLRNRAPMKTLARNHLTCSLCGLPYATVELCFYAWSVRSLYNTSSSVQFSVGDNHGKCVENLWRFNVWIETLCVIITVILKALQLFVFTTCEDPLNPVSNPNPRLRHPYMWQYHIP